jgi:hypothetical protein
MDTGEFSVAGMSVIRENTSNIDHSHVVNMHQNLDSYFGSLMIEWLLCAYEVIRSLLVCAQTSASIVLSHVATR